MVGIFTFFMTMSVLALPIAAINEGGWGFLTCLTLSLVAGIIVYLRVDLEGRVSFRQAAIWCLHVFGGGILIFVALMWVLFLLSDFL